MRATAGGILLAAAVLSACSSSSEAGGRPPRRPAGSEQPEPSPANGVSVDAASLQAPGTALADGVEVVPGSKLVGAVFPALDFSGQSGRTNPLGWQAALVVAASDPTDVWDLYVDELGLGGRADARRACVVYAPPSAGDLDVRRRFLTEARLDEHEVLVCSARFGGTSLSMAVGALVCPEAQPEPRPRCVDRMVSHLYIEVTATDDPGLAASDELGTDDLRTERSSEHAHSEREVADVSDDPIPGGRTILPAPGANLPLSPLPGAGERVDDRIDYYLGDGDWVPPVAILPKGARSLVAPAMLIDCNSGLVAVVEVPGRPVQAVQAFTDPDAPSSADLAGTWGSGPWAGRTHESVGGYDLDTIAVPGAKGTSFVLVTECGD